MTKNPKVHTVFFSPVGRIVSTSQQKVKRFSGSVCSRGLHTRAYGGGGSTVLQRGGSLVVRVSGSSSLSDKGMTQIEEQTGGGRATLTSYDALFFLACK